MTKYWFYILKGFDGDDTYNVEKDVIIADTRDEAKELLASKFGKLPYRKPKNYDDNTLYLYLTPSDSYWYNFHHEIFSIKCVQCDKELTVKGRGNLVSNQHGEYCSIQCKVDKVKEINKDWISRDDHVGLTSVAEGSVVGYIYRITNKVTCQSYIGQTIHPALFRWWQHLKSDSKFEQSDISDLVFEVLEVVEYNKLTDTDYTDSKDKLNKRESHYISLFNTVSEGYNMVQPTV